MPEVQEKTYPPIFRSAGNMATTQDSAEEKPEVKPTPVAEQRYLHHGQFLTRKEILEWDDK